MKLGWSTGGGIATGLLLAALLAACPAGAQVLLASDGAAASAPGAVLRVIDDPATGNRWLLERERPGAPGRLVLTGSAAPTGRSPRSAAQPGWAPVLRAGDALTLVAQSATMHAELEAVALAPAAAGAALRVRVKIGGRIVAAVALAPHRAAWVAGSGEGR